MPTQTPFRALHPGFMPLIPAPVATAAEEARAIVSRAEAYAAALRAEATQVVAEAAQAAAEEAHREGVAAQAVRLAALDATLGAWLAGLELAAADALLHLAAEVWPALAPPDPAPMIAATAARLRAQLGDRHPLTLYVAPELVPSLSLSWAQVRPDPALGPGDCRLEAPALAWDSRATTRAQIALEALAARLGRAAPELPDAR